MREESSAVVRAHSGWARVALSFPGLVALAVFLAWANASGGYFPHVWYAGGLFLIAVLLVALLAWPGGLFAGLGRATAVALASFAAFTVWSYASILWADVRGDAWDGANRTALYLVVFALFALWRWADASGLVLLGVFAGSVCVLGLITIIGAVRAEDIGSYYIAGRLKDPIGYVNGNAALFLLAFWPALFLASRREIPAPLRPLFLASAGVLLELAVLPQSRGALAAFALVLLIYFLLVPSRMRTLVFLLPVLITVGLAFPRLLDAGSESAAAGLDAGATAAALTIAVSGVVLAGVGLLLVIADHRVAIPPRVRRVAARALMVGIAAFLVAGLGLAARSGDLPDRAAAAWDEFDGGDPPKTGSARLVSGLQTNRADFWRVALGEFRKHPLVGIGVENFGAAYARERRSEEQPLYPHSFPLQVLAQTGLVGTVLFAFFLAAALVAAIAAIRRERETGFAPAAAATVVFAYWLVHGSIDWFWELPALAGPAMAFLALAGFSAKSMPPTRPRSAPLLTACAAVLGVIVTISFVFPWLAARDVRRAASVWRSDPAAAASAVDRARRFNPLTDRADLVAGAIARRRGDWDAMGEAYEQAAERNPHSWYSHLQLALARARQGRRGAALDALEVARQLNPSEPLIDLVAGWLERGERVRVAEVAEILLERHARVTGTEQEAETTRQP